MSTTPEVRELLAAIRDTLDVTGDDRAAVRRMVSVRLEVGAVLVAMKADEERPHLPSITPEVLRGAADRLRSREGGQS